jgi:hypothetical protein
MRLMPNHESVPPHPVSAPEVVTVRYRAAGRWSYGRALLALTMLAREHAGDQFSFGPLDIGALETGGLVVTGTDLSAVTDVLAGVPGLVQSPE